MELVSERQPPAGPEGPAPRPTAPDPDGHPCPPDGATVLPSPWSAVVFARNEATQLAGTLQALSACVGAVPLHLTVILNGATDGSDAVAIAAARASGLACRVYAIPFADKSHAINCFLHSLRPPAETYFFVDGYAAVHPDALTLLAEALARRPHAHAAAAVPSTGRSAAALRRAMLDSPGLHGSLFALRRPFVERLVATGLRLPIGLYRGDGLLGAIVQHDLDARGSPWDTARIAVQPEASWWAPRSKIWSPSDLRRQWQRMIRQAQGRMESRAIREVIRQGGFTALPATVQELVLGWIAQDPAGRVPRPWRDPMETLALRALRRWAAPAEEALQPILLFERAGASPA